MAFITVICCCIFTAQLVVFIKDTLSSTQLYTEVSRERLFDQPLPLKISICLKPGLNQTELLNTGYSDERYYTYGMSRYYNKTNNILPGWGGHSENGTCLYTDISVLERKLVT